MDFPDPRFSDDHGLLCVGGDLSVNTLRRAYEKGIFPWPQPGLPLLWFSPPERGVLDFARLHVPRRLARKMRGASYRITFNQAFAQVIAECSRQPRPGQAGTWILPAMITAYEAFHYAGYAHSVECWSGEQLVGGLYGVFVGNVFSGESMFYREPDASKLCLLALIEHLKKIGLDWMDTQMVTPVLQSMGAHTIAREDFLGRLERAHRVEAKEF